MAITVGTSGTTVGASVNVDIDSGADIFIAFVGQSRTPPNIDQVASAYTIDSTYQASGVFSYQANTTVTSYACIGVYWLAADLPSSGTYALTRTNAIAGDYWAWLNASGVAQDSPEDTDTVDADFGTSSTITLTNTTGALVILGEYLADDSPNYSASVGTLVYDTGRECCIYTTSGDTVTVGHDNNRRTGSAASFAEAGPDYTQTASISLYFQTNGTQDLAGIYTQVGATNINFVTDGRQLLLGGPSPALRMILGGLL